MTFPIANPIRQDEESLSKMITIGERNITSREQLNKVKHHSEPDATSANQQQKYGQEAWSFTTLLRTYFSSHNRLEQPPALSRYGKSMLE